MTGADRADVNDRLAAKPQHFARAAEILRAAADHDRQRGVLRAYRRAGFKEFGRLRESFRIGGRVYDTIYMDCLSSEFESPLLRRILVGLAPPDVDDELP